MDETGSSSAITRTTAAGLHRGIPRGMVFILIWMNWCHGSPSEDNAAKTGPPSHHRRCPGADGEPLFLPLSRGGMGNILSLWHSPDRRWPGDHSCGLDRAP